MDVTDRSNRPEQLGGMNPSLRVPTLVLDDGRPLGESGAILWYFGEGTRFVPEDRYERAQVLQWMFFEQYDHEPALAVVRFWVAYSGRAEEFADRLEERMAAGYRALDAMEGHLEGRDYLVGDEPHAGRHRPVRLHARRARGRLRPRALPGCPRLDRARGGRAGPRSDRRLAEPAVSRCQARCHVRSGRRGPELQALPQFSELPCRPGGRVPVPGTVRGSGAGRGRRRRSGPDGIGSPRRGCTGARAAEP